MSTIMRHCVASGLLFCSLLGLWFVGVVPSLGLVIGIFSLLSFVAITNYIKPLRIGRIAVWFYAALALFIALNAVYSLIPESIREELGLIRGSETIKTAEQLHQPGGKTLQVIREQCKTDFDKGLKEALDKLRQSASPNKTEELIQDLQKLEERREKCSNAILKLGEKGSVGKDNQATNLQETDAQRLFRQAQEKYVNDRNKEKKIAEEEEEKRRKLLNSLKVKGSGNEKLDRSLFVALSQVWYFYEQRTETDKYGRVRKKYINYIYDESDREYRGYYYQKTIYLYFGEQVLREYHGKDWTYSGRCCRGLIQVEKDDLWYTGKGEFLDIRLTNDSEGNPLSVLLILQDEQGKEVVRREVRRKDEQQAVEISPTAPTAPTMISPPPPPSPVQKPVHTDNRGDTTIDITKQSQDAKKHQAKKK